MPNHTLAANASTATMDAAINTGFALFFGPVFSGPEPDAVESRTSVFDITQPTLPSGNTYSIPRMRPLTPPDDENGGGPAVFRQYRRHRRTSTDYFGVTPINGASCDAIGFRFSLSGSTLGMSSHGCGTSGSANTMRFALRTPVTLPCGVVQFASRFSG